VSSVSVTVTNAHRRYRIHRQRTADYVRRVLRQERKARAEISVVFVDGAKMRRLNARYLGHDYATDVIAFPLSDTGRPDGEIYVNVDRAREQADHYGVRFGDEIARLVIHGTLHLAGYDDAGKAPARRMKAVEDSHVMYWSAKKKVGE